MPNDVNWSDAVWTEINDAVKAEVAKVRIAQKVFPTVVLDAGATNVADEVINFANLSVDEGAQKPFTEIFREFRLTSTQVQLEPQLKTAKTLARMAAKEVALAEDLVIFQGTNGNPPRGVNIERRVSTGTGLLGQATAVNVNPRKPQPPDYGENTFAGVTSGIATLTTAAQATPFALILPTSQFADTYIPPSPASLVTTAERIKPLVEGGFYVSGELPNKSGLLVALGGDPVMLYVGLEARAEFLKKDGPDYFFRVVERIQFVVRDKRALITLAFQ
jgi:uncharacterized linocin/CFP29 family protein